MAPPANVQREVGAVWSVESAKVIGRVARMVGDVGVAEELAGDALVAALEQWPRDGVPANPGAWLMTVAKRRAVDWLRRRERLQRKQDELGHQLAVAYGHTGGREDDLDAVLDDDVGDDRLGLIFMACHPVLSSQARVALTLRLLGGLRTDEIARAFLVPESTVAQRVVRAKKTLAANDVTYELPDRSALPERLDSVLEVLYLIFNEGYTATAGDSWLRPELCHEALRLGRVLAGLLPDEPEVHGLLALMEIQSSRLRARTSPTGEPVLLLDQNRGLWDWVQIERGLAALDRTIELDGEDGPYAMQAAIASVHARARRPEDTDFARSADLYDRLAAQSPSPVVELNRAVAHGQAYGPAAGLEILQPLLDDASLAGYHLLPSVHGDLLLRLDRRDEARAAFEQAASLTRNERERALLLDRAASC